MNALLWLVGLILLVVVVTPLRRRLLTAPIARWTRARLAPLSDTEREALEAGSVGWERELFSGRPRWASLTDLPAPALSPTGRAFLNGPVETLCTLLDDWAIQRQGDLPPPVWRFLKENRFFGLVIPERYGGWGFSAEEHSVVVQKIASRSVAAAVVVMVPNSLGPAKLILHHGTEEQRERYLPRLARGEEIPCFALTSPLAGSDAAAIPDVGVVEAGPEGTPVIRLTFDKRYITLAPVATLIGLAFQLRDPGNLLGGGVARGITLALLPVTTPGVEVGDRHDPMGVAFPNGPVRGRGVVLPLSAVIGGEAGIGQGWRMVMACLAEGRAISLPALSVGALKLAARVAGAHARVRHQFGLPIGRFEGVREPLARIAGNLYLAEAARAFTLLAVDRGERPTVASALVKVQLTERMRRGLGDAMDILGGNAISQGPANLLGHPYQAIPIGITVEGANILTRSLILFGQGVLRGHPRLLEETWALQDPDLARGDAAFDRLFLGHLGRILALVLAMPFLALGGHRLIMVPGAGGAVRRGFQELTRLSARFALASEAALLLLGGAIKRREMLSGRLADLLAHLYLGGAVIQRFHARGEPLEERPLFLWAMAHVLEQGEQALWDFLANLTPRPVAWLLGALLLPRGRTRHAPSDRLAHGVAETLLVPSPLRDRLTAWMFLPRGEGEPLARLERAMVLTVAAEEGERMVQVALKRMGLSGADPEALERALATLPVARAEQVRAARRAQWAAIQVDAFPPVRERMAVITPLAEKAA